jgi:ParB-like chromosome segregation protein Spo0J
MTYPIHPACACWPAMNGAQIQEVATDIKRNGLLYPGIITKDGQLLAGKNRQRACEIAGVEFRVTVYEGDDPEGVTISDNKHRQHYSPAQLALIGEALTKLKHGGDRQSNKFQVSRETLENKACKEIADQLKISPTLIGDARRLRKTAIPEIIKMVDDKKIGIKNAAAYAFHTPKDKQVADPKIIKNEGHQLRTPRKLAARKARPSSAGETMVPLKLVVKEFFPLFQRIFEQSKRHVAAISVAELAMIGARGKKILRQWGAQDVVVDPDETTHPSLARPDHKETETCNSTSS